jgi:hypothetical protein
MTTNDPYRPGPVEFPPTTDEKNLGLLSIFHYVVRTLLAMMSCFFVIYIVLGIQMIRGSAGIFAVSAGPPPPPWMGSIFVTMGAVAVFFGWAMAGATALSGRFLAQRQRYPFCLVVAGLLCFWMPFGTILGVFTLVILTKPHVRAQFTSAPRASRSSSPRRWDARCHRWVMPTQACSRSRRSRTRSARPRSAGLFSQRGASGYSRCHTYLRAAFVTPRHFSRNLRGRSSKDGR